MSVEPISVLIAVLVIGATFGWLQHNRPGDSASPGQARNRSLCLLCRELPARPGCRRLRDRTGTMQDAVPDGFLPLNFCKHIWSRFPAGLPL